MSKYVDLTKILTKLPDFAFDYIEMAYDGESVNTQIGYSIDIKTFLEYLKNASILGELFSKLKRPFILQLREITA